MKEHQATVDMTTAHPAQAATAPGGFPGDWTGNFIWDKGERSPFHYSLLFRRTFPLADLPARAVIRIAAADKYRLFVNGHYLARGPARTVGPQLTPYDTHDLGGLLRPGKNVVAVFAYHYGCYNAFSVNQRAGLWAELALTAAVGSPAGETIIGTDAGWRVRPFAGYRRDRQGRLTLCVLNASLDPVAQARLLVREDHAYQLLRADGEEQDVQLVGRDGEYDVLELPSLAPWEMVLLR